MVLTGVEKIGLNRWLKNIPLLKDKMPEKADVFQPKDLIKQYYDAFNQQDMKTFLNCLSENVIHDINQGTSQNGKDAFSKFMDHMNHCYKEKAIDLVIMVNEDDTRAAAEFIIEGTYLSTDKGLPEAKSQHYRSPVGAFFSIENNKITRVTNYYNMQDWINQVAR